MTLKLVNAGERIDLEYLVNKSSPENLVLRLFQNDYTPADSDTTANYTEATFTGYAPVTLIGATWSVVEGDPAVASYPQVDFTATANQTLQTIYGYYVTRLTGGELMWAENLSAPQDIQTNGDNVGIITTIDCQDVTD